MLCVFLRIIRTLDLSIQNNLICYHATGECFCALLELCFSFWAGLYNWIQATHALGLYLSTLYFCGGHPGLELSHVCRPQFRFCLFLSCLYFSGFSHFSDLLIPSFDLNILVLILTSWLSYTLLYAQAISELLLLSQVTISLVFISFRWNTSLVFIASWIRPQHLINKCSNYLEIF